jgi:hypothetical protein
MYQWVVIKLIDKKLLKSQSPNDEGVTCSETMIQHYFEIWQDFFRKESLFLCPQT